MKIRYSLITFDLPLPVHKIAAFRSAMIEWAGRENDLLHNHLNQSEESDKDRGGFTYRYPLVQYRVNRGKAALFALNEGADIVCEVLTKSNWELEFDRKITPLRIADFKNREFTLAYTPQPKTYFLQNWVALNQQNYLKYTQTNSLIERLEMLQKILASNIISFAKGVKWQIPQKFEVAIQELLRSDSLHFHQTKLSSFDVQFSCPLALPPEIGIGKAVSHGLGVLNPAPIPKIG